MDRLASMKVFQSVSDEGSFAAAARALDLSPAAVTRFVADLEEGLGVRLLHRTTRRLALTQAGEVYLERVRRILQDIDEADAQASSHTIELVGDLRVSATPALATHVLAPLLAGFRALYPNIGLDIEVAVAGPGVIEEFDLTLFGADAGFDADVIARPILETDAVLVASPEYLRRKSMPSQPQELVGHDHLVSRRTGSRASLLRLWPAGQPEQLVELDVRPALSANNGDALLRAALDGAGMASFPLDLAAPYLTNGQLVRVLSPWVTGRLTMYAAMPSRRFVPERTRRFLDYLIQQTRQQTAAALAVCEACHAQWQPSTASPANGAGPKGAPDVDFIDPHALLLAKGGLQAPLLLDIRSPISLPRPDDDIPGAIRADVGQVLDAVRHTPPDRPIVTLCACRGDAGAIDAARELQRAGYQGVRVLRGGVDAWRQTLQAAAVHDRKRT